MAPKLSLSDLLDGTHQAWELTYRDDLFGLAGYADVRKQDAAEARKREGTLKHQFQDLAKYIFG